MRNLAAILCPAISFRPYRPRSLHTDTNKARTRYAVPSLCRTLIAVAAGLKPEFDSSREIPTKSAMNVPNFVESEVSPIPAVQPVMKLTNASLSGSGIGGSNPPVSAVDFRLVIQSVFGFLDPNRPSKPLNDAQLGGYFFAQIPRLGNTSR